MAPTEPPGSELIFTAPRMELRCYQEPQQIYGTTQYPTEPKSPAEWFSQKFTEATQIYGCPFIEHRVRLLNGFDTVTPVDLNLDFFAGILGGEKKLGHSVIYYETDMQFYFLDPVDQLYKITSPEKLQHLIRALLMKCAQEMPREIQLLNLFHQFRSEKFTRQILQRAKSILAADESFFSPESKNQRKAGPEIPERLARVFVESMLEKREGSILTVTQAYNLFSHLSLENQLHPIKRAPFRQMMSELMKGTFGLSLRRDVKDEPV